MVITPYLNLCADLPRGQWHGDVAIKLLDTGNSADNEQMMKDFKTEVGTHFEMNRSILAKK